MSLFRLFLFTLLVPFVSVSSGFLASAAAQAQTPEPAPILVAPAAAEIDGMPPITSGAVVTNPVFTPPQLAFPQSELNADAAPVITLWYGNYQRFGVLGHPVPLINILGTVSPATNLASLTYAVNGTPGELLNVGPDDQRLAEAGDFNIEIDRTTLVAGTNSVVITATTNSAEVATATVTVEYMPNSQWPQSFDALWASSTNIQDIAQVIDGKWALKNDGTLRPTVIDYDRLIAMGDQQWTSYEVSVPITIHSIDNSGFTAPSNGPGIGMIMRWPGHYLDDPGEQPRTGWRELGGLAWFRWGKDKNNNNAIIVAQHLLGYRGRQLATDPNRVPAFNVPYIFKVSIQPVAGGGDLYRFKVWAAADPEPLAWDLVANNHDNEPTQGSVVLLAHHVDATFGTATVRPIDQIHPQVLTSVTGLGRVEVTPVGPYVYGQTVTVRAIADVGYAFGGWNGDVSSQAGELSVELTKDVTLDALFTQVGTATLLTGTIGSGTITVDPVQGTYGVGQQIQVTAEAIAGWSFVGWQGDLSGTANPATLTMDANKVITATFAQEEFTLSTNVSGSGEIHINPENQNLYAPGEVVTLTPVPQPGWQFSGWSGDLSGSANPAQLTIDGNKQVTALFVPAAYTLTITKEGEGTVSHSPIAVTYSYGERVILTAQPASGWQFEGWSGDLNGAVSPIAITMDSNKTVNARFIPKQYKLTLQVAGDGSGAVTATPAGPYTSGQQVQIEAIPAAGSHFVSWVGGETLNPLTITITGDETVAALFAQDRYQITTQVVNEQGQPLANAAIVLSEPTATDGYRYGETISVTAIAPEGWRFAGWDGAVTGAGITTTMVVTENVTIIGRFAPVTVIHHVMTVSTNSNGGTIAVTPAAPYLDGQVVTVTLTITPGWEFTGWGGDVSGTVNPLVFTIERDTEIVANLQQTEYALTLLPKDSTGAQRGGRVVADPEGPYHYGQIVTLTALADPGYAFVQWLDASTIANADADEHVGQRAGMDEPTIQITITNNVTYTAQFQAISNERRIFLPIVMR